MKKLVDEIMRHESFRAVTNSTVNFSPFRKYLKKQLRKVRDKAYERGYEGGYGYAECHFNESLDGDG